MALLNIFRPSRPGLRRWRCAGWATAMLGALTGLSTAHAQLRMPFAEEYKVKAVFLYNFVQFVTWPEGAFDSPRSPWVVGVLGYDPFGDELERTFQTERIDGRPFVIRRYVGVEEIGVCHVLFISPSENHRLDEIFPKLAGRSILTVGETERFIQAGGMIRFRMDQNRVRLQINPQAARRANLSISSKLLRLADVLEEPADENRQAPPEEKR